MAMEQADYGQGGAAPPGQAYNMDRMRVDSRKGPGPNQHLLISPMKFVSPRRDSNNLYQDAMAEQMAGLQPSGGRRHLNTVSPHKMMLQDHLASGQAHVGTPMRSRIDSQDSRAGMAYPPLKSDEHMMPGKETIGHFLSPNVRSKLPQPGDH